MCLDLYLINSLEPVHFTDLMNSACSNCVATIRVGQIKLLYVHVYTLFMHYIPLYASPVGGTCRR
jgi:hypothetical protein